MGTHLDSALNGTPFLVQMVGEDGKRWERGLEGGKDEGETHLLTERYAQKTNKNFHGYRIVTS